MPPFDYNAPAELFRRRGFRRGVQGPTRHESGCFVVEIGFVTYERQNGSHVRPCLVRVFSTSPLSLHASEGENLEATCQSARGAQVSDFLKHKAQVGSIG